MNEKDKLRKFQEFIDYEFNDKELLRESLTTPQLGNEKGIPSYEFLETLGDAVIKIVLILKLYKKGVKDPGEITKMKATLESDNTLKNIARKIDLEKYILKTEKQRIKGTRILADIIESICGALFLDSEDSLNLVEQKMINPFFEDLNVIIQTSMISSKNTLLEFLQEKFKTNITIELEYEKNGEQHDLIWIAKNPRIIDKFSKKKLLKISRDLKSGKFNSKKDAEKDIYAKILEYLKTNKK